MKTKVAGIIFIAALLLFTTVVSVNNKDEFMKEKTEQAEALEEVEENTEPEVSDEETGTENTTEVNEKTAYFAGGCFWGMEKFMDSVPGVLDVVSGYANGDAETYATPSYDDVLTGLTGYKEAVQVTYDGNKLPYEMLVRAYYIAIDPTVKNRQANDIGEQYQTGIYYLDDEQKAVAEKVSEEIKATVDKFEVEVEHLENFYDAEEYHQNYLVKNPSGYCHISTEEINEMLEMFGATHVYEKPDDETLKKTLSPLQYSVTQNADTEPAFDNEYWDFFEKGIYVDIVSGEPLFTSEEKYPSSCGWPSFAMTHNDNLKYAVDYSNNMTRFEVFSNYAESHLGHVFSDTESPTGVRYCMNSAALKFIPYDDLEKEGYDYVKAWFNER